MIQSTWIWWLRLDHPLLMDVTLGDSVRSVIAFARLQEFVDATEPSERAEMSASEMIGWGIEMVEQWHAERCRERFDTVLTSGFVGCLTAAPSDLAQNHRRYLDEAFGAPGDAG